MSDWTKDPITEEMGSQKLELSALLMRALKDAPQNVELVSINYCLSEAARKNDKRPAYIEFYCPDQWVVNLVKNQKLLDGFIALRVSREYLESYMKERKDGAEDMGRTLEASGETVSGESSESSLQPS